MNFLHVFAAKGENIVMPQQAAALISEMPAWLCKTINEHLVFTIHAAGSFRTANKLPSYQRLTHIHCLNNCNSEGVISLPKITIKKPTL